MLEGKLVRLRAVERSDLPAFVRWFNDSEVTQFLLRSPPMSMEEEEHWYDGLLTREGKVFAIDTLEGKLIGNAAIVHIDYTERKADVGILIGEKDYWSKGYGTDALTVLLGYMFDELNMERIWLYADERNEKAQSCYRKVGFRKEGVLRHNRYKDGVFTDDVVMSVLLPEWREKHPVKK
jgi:RimJ/RimL family protein N-acetyltransferase